MSEMDITIRTGRLWWKRRRTFRGDGTVWHDVATGCRASTTLEYQLSNIWWKRQQPEYQQSDTELQSPENAK